MYLVIDSLKELWYIMDLKSIEVQENFKKNNKHNKAEWLNGWMNDSRLTTLIEFMELNLPDMDEIGIAKLHKRLTRYINYFDILEKSGEDKYDCMFNYLTDIPCQIVHFISNYNN